MKPEQLLEKLDKIWRSASTIDDHVMWGHSISTQDLRDFVNWVKERESLLFRAAQLYEQAFDHECECGTTGGVTCRHCALIGKARSLVHKAVQKHPYLEDEGEPQSANTELLQELFEPTVECMCSRCGLTWTKTTCGWNYLLDTWVCRRCGNRLTFMQPKLKEPNVKLESPEPIPSEAATRQTVRVRAEGWFQRNVLSHFKQPQAEDHRD